jgi:hypothetical protein
MAIWSILRPYSIIFGHLVYLWSFGIFFPFWYVVARQNLATLVGTEEDEEKRLGKQVALRSNVERQNVEKMAETATF